MKLREVQEQRLLSSQEPDRDARLVVSSTVIPNRDYLMSVKGVGTGVQAIGEGEICVVRAQVRQPLVSPRTVMVSVRR